MKSRIVALIVVAFGFLAAIYYARSVFPGCLEFCGNLHRETVAATAVSPHRYRVLAPGLIEFLFHPVSDTEIAVAYSVAHALIIPAMFGALWLWFRRWTSDISALVGILVVAAYSPIMFRVYGISLNNPLEVLFLVAGLFLLLNKRDGLAFAALVVVATLNRETGILLPIAYAALNYTRWRDWRVVMKLLVFGGLWACIFVGLRVILGAAPDMITIEQIARANLGGGWNTSEALLNNAFLIPIWFAALVGWRSAPAPLKRLSLAGLPYLGLLAVFALWDETRLLLPLIVLWMPLALRWLGDDVTKPSMALSSKLGSS